MISLQAVKVKPLGFKKQLKTMWMCPDKTTFMRKTISANMNEWAIASIFEGKLSGRLAWIQKAERSCPIWSSLSFITYGSWNPIQYQNIVNLYQEKLQLIRSTDRDQFGYSPHQSNFGIL